MKERVSILVSALFLILFIAGSAIAQQTYTAVNNGDWGNPGTWDLDGVPGDRDVAVIGSPRIVTLDGVVTIEGLTFTGGTLDGEGELTITEDFLWEGGNLGGEVDEINIVVKLTEQTTGLWRGFSKNLNARIDNEGTINWTEGTISTRLTGLGILNNEGVFNANAAASANFIQFINHPGAVVSKSTLGTTTFSSGLFENRGVVDLREGTLDIGGSTSLPDPGDTGTYLTDPGTELIFRTANRDFDGEANIESSAQVTFQSGNIHIKGTYQSPNTRINGGTLQFDTGSMLSLPQLTIGGGTITGFDEIELTGDSEWISGSTIENAGVIINEGVTFTISGGGLKQLNTTLANDGTIDWEAGSWGTSTTGLGTVFNNSTGQINIRGDGNASSLDIRNFGTIDRSGSSGQASIISGFFQNESSGTVEINSGTLRIGGSTALATPSDQGDYEIASGATLRLQQNRELSASSSISGDRLWIDNGSTTISGSLDVESVDVEGVSANLTLSGSTPFSIPVLNMAGNSLTAIVPLAVTDAMAWERGTIEGPGVINISSTGALAISGSLSRNLNGIIVSDAVTTWEGGRINSSNTGGGEFVNNGEFRIETDDEFSRAIFTNNRTVRKTSGGTSRFSVNTFTNSGDVEIESGILQLSTTAQLSTPVDDGTYTLSEGARLLVDGAPRQLSPDGEIRGPSTIEAATFNLIDNRGTHSPGNSTGIMVYNGEFSMDAATAEINIVLNGTTPGSGHDQIQITESAAFDQGILNVELASGYTPSEGDEFEIIIYGRHQGEFDEINLPALGGGLEFDVNFGHESSLILSVIDPSPNEPPVFTTTFDEETITEGDEFSFQFEADDPDGDDLIFSLTEGGDVDNASITTTGLFTFNPEPGQAGSYDFTVRVSDGDLSDEHDFIVNVEATNQPPVFESDPVTIAQVGEQYTYNVETSDPDGDPVTVSAITLPDWLSFMADDGGTGTLEGTPSESDIGDHDVVLQASDGEDTTTQEFTIEVREAPNEPPVFTTTFDEETITEGDEFSFQFEADDPDGDDLTFSLTEGGDVDNASITTMGLFTFNPEAGQAGSYDFTVRVSDGDLSDEHDFIVNVEATNQPPVFESDPVTIVQAGEPNEYNVVASDPDGDDLTLTAPTLPSWLSFTDNGDGTGLLEGTPTESDVGNHDVELVADDGEETTTQEFTIRVREDSDEIVIRFEITDLGHLGGGTSIARDINGDGVIVGASVNSSGETTGFIWQAESMSAPSLPGQSHFYSISGSHIAGIVQEGEGVRALKSSPDLSNNQILGPESGYSVAYGANSTFVSGVQKNVNGQYVAALMNASGTQFLDLMDSDMSVAYDVSSNGRVAGTLFTVNGEARGFVDDNIGPANSRFYTVSSNGTAAGSINGSPAVWQPGSDPQVFEGNGEIYSRNQSGWAVGSITPGAAKLQPETGKRYLDEKPWLNERAKAAKALENMRAAIWMNGEFYDLNEMLLQDESWLLLEASGINESGQITGTGLQNGQLRAFLLNPVETTANTETDELFSSNALEAGVHLHQNYPNPFNPSTQLVFDLTEPNDVNLQVFDMLGRLVATVVDARMEAGIHTVHFDAGHLSSGIYIYTIRTHQSIQTRKMTLMK